MTGREGHLSILHTWTLSLSIDLMCSVTNRVSCWDLDDSKPIRPVQDLPNSSFLPSLEEHANLRADYIILVLRILVKHCNYFKKFSRLVLGHIPHQFSKEMRKETQVVSH